MDPFHKVSWFSFIFYQCGKDGTAFFFETVDDPNLLEIHDSNCALIGISHHMT